MSGNNSGWNRPAANQPTVKKGRTPPPSKVKGIVAGAVAVVVGVVCIFAFSDKSEKPVKDTGMKPAKIKDVAPALVPKTNEVAAAPIDKSKLSPAWQRYYDGRDTNKWKVVYNPVTKREYLSRIVKYGRKNAPPPLYRNPSLNVLDAIAFKPIISPMANVRIDERFMKQFQNALVEKIEILPDDSEEVRARKEGMIQLMADLKKRIKAGENVQQIIADSLADRNRVASLKAAMQSERANMRRNGTPENEIDEFVAACNKRLEEKGATPIRTKAMMEAVFEARQSAGHAGTSELSPKTENKK